MDNSNWRPSQGGAEPAIDTGDWRTQLQNESRQRIVNKIMDTLKRHLPFSGQEGLQELKKIAIRFEEKIYTAATSQSDYLRKISLKMLTMESKSQNTMANSLPSNSAGSSKTPTDAGSIGMASQTGNQGPTIQVPMGANQGQPRQQLLAQAIQNNMAAPVIQGSSGLTSNMPSGGGVPQTSATNVGQNNNSQNMQGISSGVSQNSVANSIGQGVSANMYANTQRQMQGRQQLLSQQQQQQQQQQQPQNPQILYQQQMHQQQYRQKYPQGNIQNPHMQSQQNLVQSSQQSVMQSNLPANQQSSVQQSVLRQHSQIQQPQSIMSQQQQQQQQQLLLLGQQPNSTSLHPNQLLGQQNMSDMQQQQRLLAQQNNISNLQQQPQQQLMGQLGPQGNVPGIHQQQQQQVLGTQSGNSSMQNNQQHPVQMVQQQTKVAMPPQQNQQNNPTALLPSTQGQQHSQSQMPPQQTIPQIQSQQLGMQQQQQQQNQLHRDKQQRLQSSVPLLQPHSMIDQQKQQQLFPSQRTIPDAPSSSSDSTAQTGNLNGGDWQEEVYQKIKTMKEAYLPELNEMYQKIAGKLQQHDTLPQQPKNEQVEKLKIFKAMLERIMTFLQVSKNNILPTFREKLAGYEKQIINFLNSNRPRKPGPSIQQPQQLPPSQIQHQQSQISQVQPHENAMSSQVQSMNAQGSVNMLQQNNMPSLQYNSLSSLPGVPNANQNIISSLQSNSNIESGHGNTHNTMQQATVGMQHSIGAPQQVNMNSFSSLNGLSSLQPNLSPLQTNSNMLQQQQFKQQEQMLQNHQMKQKIQQHHIQQQMIHKQQLLQQQQQQQQQQQMLQQTKLQQNAQLQAHGMPQLHQMNDIDMKMRQQVGIKGGSFQQNQRSMYHHQQLKSGSPFAMSSPQLVQSGSPQMSHQHPSPQMDQQNLMSSSLTKTGTPLQSANSPFIVPSPCTPLAPSPMPGGESEKVATSGVSAPPPSVGVGNQQQQAAAQSLAIGTPGISASPLLAEFISPDGTLGNMSAVVSGKSTLATELPLDRLFKAVKSMSTNELRDSVSDIGSVVSMIDRIAGSAPGNGSRAAVGEDLVAMTKCRLQARNFITHEGNGGTRKMRRYTSAMPLNVASSTGSVNDSFKHLTARDTADLDSTATSSIKRPRVEASHVLLEEIREINQWLIDTVVGVSEEDIDATASAAAASEGGEGTIVKCSYCAIALSPNLKSQYSSTQMSPIQPLRLLIPTNYPCLSPILLDNFPIEASREYEDLSMKAKSRFNISLRNLSQPMSLGEIARTWDMCARGVISEYAQQRGGGSFSSKYGTWENCLSAT